MLADLVGLVIDGIKYNEKSSEYFRVELSQS